MQNLHYPHTNNPYTIEISDKIYCVLQTLKWESPGQILVKNKTEREVRSKMKGMDESTQPGSQPQVKN